LADLRKAFVCFPESTHGYISTILSESLEQTIIVPELASSSQPYAATASITAATKTPAATISTTV